jgi:hypothetical protein
MLVLPLYETAFIAVAVPPSVFVNTILYVPAVFAGVVTVNCVDYFLLWT